MAIPTLLFNNTYPQAIMQPLNWLFLGSKNRYVCLKNHSFGQFALLILKSNHKNSLFSGCILLDYKVLLKEQLDFGMTCSSILVLIELDISLTIV